MIGKDAERLDLDKKYKAFGFQLGKKETVQDRKAQIVAFKVSVEGMKDVIPVSLYIDLENHLPLKQVIQMKTDEGEMVNTETYNGFILNKEIDAKLFEIPEATQASEDDKPESGASKKKESLPAKDEKLPVADKTKP